MPAKIQHWVLKTLQLEEILLRMVQILMQQLNLLKLLMKQ